MVDLGSCTVRIPRRVGTLARSTTLALRVRRGIVRGSIAHGPNGERLRPVHALLSVELSVARRAGIALAIATPLGLTAQGASGIEWCGLPPAARGGGGTLAALLAGGHALREPEREREKHMDEHNTAAGSDEGAQ